MSKANPKTNVMSIVEFKGRRAFKTLADHGVESVDQLPDLDLAEQVFKDLMQDARRKLWECLEDDEPGPA